MPLAGTVINAGVLVSMFAATLAFVIALGRLAMLMARHHLVPIPLARTSERHKTPTIAALLVGALALLPVVLLLLHGASGAEVYGWMGSLSVFGYLTTYLLIALAVVVRRPTQNKHYSACWSGCARDACRGAQQSSPGTPCSLPLLSPLLSSFRAGSWSLAWGKHILGTGWSIDECRTSLKNAASQPGQVLGSRRRSSRHN